MEQFSLFHALFQVCEMPKKGQLTYTDKQRIVADLAEGLILLDLAKELGRNERTLVSYEEKRNTTPRKDKCTSAHFS